MDAAQPARSVKRKVFKVAYPRLKCPACESMCIRTVGTKWPLRNHRCMKCGQRFQSVDPGPRR